MSFIATPDYEGRFACKAHNTMLDESKMSQDAIVTILSKYKVYHELAESFTRYVMDG